MKDSLPQNAYDKLADSYAALVDTKPHNAYYDRPAIQSLLFDLKEKDGWFVFSTEHPFFSYKYNKIKK